MQSQYTAFLRKAELQQIYHSSRLHQTPNEVSQKMKQRLRVTEQKEVRFQASSLTAIWLLIEWDYFLQQYKFLPVQ